MWRAARAATRARCACCAAWRLSVRRSGRGSRPGGANGRGRRRTHWERRREGDAPVRNDRTRARMTGATLFLVGWSGVWVIVLGILGARAERRAGGRHAARHAVTAPGLPGGRGETLGFLTRHLCTPGSAASRSSYSRSQASCGRLRRASSSGSSSPTRCRRRSSPLAS
jgi:hypothetical protein